MNLPLVQDLEPVPDPWDCFLRWSHLPHCIFLESSQRHPTWGRYSFLAADPFDWIAERASPLHGTSASVGPFAQSWRQSWESVQRHLQQFSIDPVPGLPPFQGGAAGLLGYEWAHAWERLPCPRFQEFPLPGMALGLYDVVLAWDHQRNRAWLVSTGFPEWGPSRQERALARRDQLLSLLDRAVPNSAAKVPDPPAIEIASPVFQTPYPGVLSNFSSRGYQQAVAQAVQWIRQGECFQINLSQRLLTRQLQSAVECYSKLRARAPATFSAYLDLGEFQVLSSSPERFLRVLDREVEARPIKGTRPEHPSPEANLFARSDLVGSPKDVAENTMIVDLMRNDLSRVCQPPSVRVTQLCGLESMGYVHHLVSVIQGRLSDEAQRWDVLQAAFPSGSVTGAPKIRAMELITELEQVARGAYCGSLGYLGFEGSMDFNVLIRTITVGQGWCQFPVGGGIVADSDPEQEYQESWDKAAGMLKALL